MADMPLDTLYCEVDFDISKLIADSDGNGRPDRLPLSGQVTFAPSIGQTAFVHKPTGAIIYADVETVTVSPDGTGKVTLVANDSPDLYAQTGNVWKPAAWNYKVTITPAVSGGIRRAPIELTISVPGGVSATLGQLLLGDLTGATKLPSSGSSTTSPPSTSTTPALSVVPSSDGLTASLSGSGVTESADGLTATIPDSVGTLNADQTILTAA